MSQDEVDMIAIDDDECAAAIVQPEAICAPRIASSDRRGPLPSPPFRPLSPDDPTTSNAINLTLIVFTTNLDILDLPRLQLPFHLPHLPVSKESILIKWLSHLSLER